MNSGVWHKHPPKRKLPAQNTGVLLTQFLPLFFFINFVSWIGFVLLLSPVYMESLEMETRKIPDSDITAPQSLMSVTRHIKQGL